MFPMSIHTRRLLIREIVESDWSAIHEYASQIDVCRYEPWGPNTEGETRAFVERVVVEQKTWPRLAYQMGVIEKESGKFIGACRIGIQSETHRNADIGYSLRKDRWGKGYGTEIARALIDFGFNELNLHRVGAHCDTRNLASARVLEKAGMSHEGTARQNMLLRGHWRDTHWFGVVRGDS